MKTCKLCVLPLSSDTVSKENEDICSLCINSTHSPEKETLDTTNIDQIIQSIKDKNKNSDFDCVVGVSGGRDSTFLLHQLVVGHGLRCLAAYHRTPFTPDIIDENLQRITKELNVPLVRLNLSNQKHLSFTRSIVQIWLKRPDNIITNLACVPCKKHNLEIFKLAKKYKVKHVVFGSNQHETFQLGAGQFRNERTEKSLQPKKLNYFKKFLILFKRGFFTLIKYPVLLIHLSDIIKATFFYLDNRTMFLRLLFPQISSVDYFFIAGYDEAVVNKCLDDLNYSIPENCNSLWRADCSFNEIKNLMFKYSSKANYFDAYLSNMVRSGVISRNEALNRISIEGQISPGRIEEACGLLNIPSEKFHNFLNN